jgi:serine/threonine-protein kinase
VFYAVNSEGQPVALKVLRPELMPSITAQRFLREISVLRRLDHPFIAPLLDYGEAEWFIYFVMGYVQGPTLRVWLDKHGRAPIAETLGRSCQVLDAVQHAHERGIVHRDVKPENIVLAEGATVLLDFGIARAIQVSETERVTRSGFTVGTSLYMSPEQAAGSHGIDHRSDLYSLGCVLYECLAGFPPFQHPNESVVMQMHQKGDVPDIRDERPEVPKRVARAVSRALEKDPEDRFQTAAEFREALEACVEQA